ncbi:adenosylcobinamide-phosphate synthase CbiB [Gorillibacterium timonense]|uniref:adenosylcobinamide-phosphate synthase CbiB n=1 Tax=Gorillibacterium timonense TaxID=1689269 RepID=UPI00071C46F9|nr:adenosylcobinamide-phosphate synthase CbiB [Gorillibacterium timonense]
MLFYSWQENMLMAAVALALDWLIGDPAWPTHPVIWMGRAITWLEKRLRRSDGKRVKAGDENALTSGGGETVSSAAMATEGPELSAASLKRRGIVLTAAIVGGSAVFAVLSVSVADAIHPWLGYAVNTWLISTTLAVKGLKQAADRVAAPLAAGDRAEARKYVGWIVSRDTDRLEEPEIVRATVETVAENTVDAFVSPFCYALLGGAPLAFLYRAANTLDSMVGYKNERYLQFGWASARFDDVLNYLPARLAGWLLICITWLSRDLPVSAGRALRSVRTFARLHPSPNSGIPESAVAGALGVELGGVNVYFGAVSERARMGWPLKPLGLADIGAAVKLLYRVSYLLFGAAVVLAGVGWWLSG